MSDVLVLDGNAPAASVPLEQWERGVVIPFDKPAGWTSFDVIRSVKSVVPVKKIGHAGTLDPFATGLLVCCAGRATKRIQSFQDAPKRYVATLHLGESTPSLDPDTPVDSVMQVPIVSREELQSLLDSRFTGQIEQIPPIYSALKLEGKRAYDLARKGEAIEMKPRMVMISSIRVLSGGGSDWMIDIECGKGTYIRSLARDIARELGTCGMLTALRRTRIGGIDVDATWNPLEFKRRLAEAHDDSRTD